MALLLIGAMGMAQAATTLPPEKMREPEYRTETITRSLDVPDEIVPAVMPYMMCVVAKQNNPVFSDGKAVDLTDQPETCDQLRMNAIDYGAELYREYGIGENKEDRKSRVLTFLEEFDDFQSPPEHWSNEPLTEQD